MMTFERDRYVFVALPGQSKYVVAGSFRVSVTSDGTALGEFVYGRSYLDRPNAVELDPVQLRFARRVRRTDGFKGLFGAIRDAVPTIWFGEVIEGSGGEVPDELDDHVQGRDRPGALAFAPRLDPPRPRRRFHSIDDLARLQTVFDSVPMSGDARQRTGTDHAQGPGFVDTSHRIPRPKAVVEDDSALWVAKFVQKPAAWNHALVRHATMQLARDCGLDAVPSRIERIRGNDVLLLRRYDREWVGDGYACGRVISGLTLLKMDNTPAEKRHWSYLTLADEVRRVSSHPREDLRELFGRMCFNAAISNLNDNMAYPILFAEGHSWRLAPAASVAPKPLVEGERGDFTMICGPHGRTPSRENLVGGAGRFLLDRATAEAIYDRISATVQSSWYDVMRGAGVSVRDCDLVRPSIRGEGNRDLGAAV